MAELSNWGFTQTTKSNFKKAKIIKKSKAHAIRFPTKTTSPPIKSKTEIKKNKN